MASKTYTAQEMRDVAQCLHYNSPTKLTIEAAAMLRQSADMMEREAANDAEIERCRAELRATRERRDVCETKMRTALERVTRAESKCDTLRKLVKELADIVYDGSQEICHISGGCEYCKHTSTCTTFALITKAREVAK